MNATTPAEAAMADAWDLLDMGYHDAAVMVARARLEWAMLRRLRWPAGKKAPRVKVLLQRLRDSGAVSNKALQRIDEVYAKASSVAHGERRPGPAAAESLIAASSNGVAALLS